MTRTRAILVVLVASLSSPVAAQDPNEEKLGEVSFETSCAPEIRSSFDRAMALLHSFWYEAAEAAFLEVAEADPGCAMAHWGVAMTAVHPLWPGTPNYEKGRRATAKAVALGRRDCAREGIHRCGVANIRRRGTSGLSGQEKSVRAGHG